MSFTNEENQFAIPREKYILKNQFFFWFGNHDYLGNGEFKRDLFGYTVWQLPNYKIESDDQLKDIVPLDAIIETNLIKT